MKTLLYWVVFICLLVPLTIFSLMFWVGELGEKGLELLAKFER